MAKKYRVGGGLQVIQDGFFIGPVRDAGAPRMPSSLDISAGLMEPDEGMKSTQVREGAEEIVRVRDGAVFLPDIVEDADVIRHVTATIAEAIEDPESPFEHGFEVDFYESEARVPTGTQEVWIQGHSLHNWETGVTVEEDNSPSYELVNYLIDRPEEDLNPVDTEVIETVEGHSWLDRMIYCFHPMTGKARIFKSGEEIFSGEFSGMVERLEEELGDELGYTVKVRAALKGLPAEKEIYDRVDFDPDVKKFFNL